MYGNLWDALCVFICFLTLISFIIHLEKILLKIPLLYFHLQIVAFQLKSKTQQKAYQHTIKINNTSLLGAWEVNFTWALFCRYVTKHIKNNANCSLIPYMLAAQECAGLSC